MVPSDFKVDTSFGLLVLHWSSLEIAHVSSLLYITVLGGNKCLGLDSSETLLVLTCFFLITKTRKFPCQPQDLQSGAVLKQMPKIKYFKAIFLAKRTHVSPTMRKVG